MSGEIGKEESKSPTQDEIRDFLIERVKDAIPYAPFILPEVLAYLECEKTGDWSGWTASRNKGEQA